MDLQDDDCHHADAELKSKVDRNVRFVQLAPSFLCTQIADVSRGFRNPNGQTLDDMYEIIDDLGAGISSTVFLARDIRNREHRALKSMSRDSPEVVDDVDADALFYTELKVFQAVDHPHIVRLYDAFENHGSFILALEFCPGGNLLDHIERVEYFAEDSCAAAVRQICSAIAHLHSLKICHRDVKLANVLVSSSERHACPLLKLADFGVASFFSSDALLCGAVGTQGYMAPEVLHSEAYDERCDVWSLGVVSWVLLSGNDPKTLSRGDRVNIGNAEVSEVACDFVGWCLDVEPTKRCSATQALAHDWLTNTLPEAQAPRLVETYRRLRLFSRLSRLQRAVMQVVAYEMPAEHILELSTVFVALDTDSSGVLTPQQIREALIRVRPDRRQQFDKLFDALGFHPDHLVHYNEFVAACLGRKRYTQREVLWRAFCAFDMDRKGYISFENLKSVLQSGAVSQAFGDEKVKQAWAELDVDCTGKIEFAEFQKMMMDVSDSASLPPFTPLETPFTPFTPMPEKSPTVEQSPRNEIELSLSQEVPEDSAPISLEALLEAHDTEETAKRRRIGEVI